MRRRAAHVLVLAAALGAAAAGTSDAAGRARASAGLPRFVARYVSTTLAGGEPSVLAVHHGRDLVYSAHEGTTHLRRDGLLTPGSSCDLSSPAAPSGFLCSYDNQVTVWHSGDGGRSWQQSSVNPLATGFSDPSLTEDAGGRVYNTGIDLANDALFSSTDGGRTWPTGTPQCHDGDRPWLAGGAKDEVFVATNTNEGTHEVFVSRDGGATCSTKGIPDAGSYPGGLSFSGVGQNLFDRRRDQLVEPMQVSDAHGTTVGVGISVLPRASQTDFGTATGGFVPSAATLKTTEIDHWPAIAQDAAGTTYVVWATQPRNASGTSGCGDVPGRTGGPDLLPNAVMIAATRDSGRHWLGPWTVARPRTTVLWPWLSAGSNGRIGVAWLQADQLTDPDCDSAKVLGGHDTRWTLQASIVTSALDRRSYPVHSVSAVPADGLHPGGVLHVGGICLGGTTCVVLGQDRRLGDYFTTGVDPRGYLMIAVGDTMRTDPATGSGYAQSRPLFLDQVSGPPLVAPGGMTPARPRPSRRSPRTG